MSKFVSRLIVPLSLALMFVGVATWTWSWAARTQASSHREAPMISGDPEVDNTDLYAFRSPDLTNTVTLIANWIPFEEPAGGPNFYHFSDNAQYNIYVDQNGDGVPDITYRWTFKTMISNPNTYLYNTNVITDVNNGSVFNYRQFYTVTETISGTTTTLVGNVPMPPDYVGPRSTPNYTTTLTNQGIYTHSASGIKIFTGQRDDPFFADIGSIFDLGGLRPFNQAHLIPISNTTGIDGLAGFNTSTTALQVPISQLVQSGCTLTDPTDKRCVIGVWSTAQRPATTTLSPGSATTSGSMVQVSRLGNPLVNEVVIPLGQKDLFNGTAPTGDAVFASSVLTPELAGLIPVLYPGVTTPLTNRQDLVQIFLTGIPTSTVAGFTNQQTGSAATPSEQLRLQTAVAPTAGVCAGNRMGILGGDLAGFPNGRRLEDDTVDIALRAVAGVLAGFNVSPNNALGDGVDFNDKACLSSFPYVATPWSGYQDTHGNRSATTPPVVPELSQILMFATGLAGLGYYALSRRRARKIAAS